MPSFARPLVLAVCALSPIAAGLAAGGCEADSGGGGGPTLGFDGGGFDAPSAAPLDGSPLDAADVPDVATDADASPVATQCGAGLWRDHSVDGGFDDGGVDGGTCRTCPVTAFNGATTDPLPKGQCDVLLLTSGPNASNYDVATKTLRLVLRPGVLEATSGSLVLGVTAAGQDSPETSTTATFVVIGNVLVADLSSADLQAAASIIVRELTVVERCGATVHIVRDVSTEPSIFFAQQDGALSLLNLVCY